MDPLAEVRRQGGIAYARDLQKRGITRRSLTVAVNRGRLLRPRRGLLADPALDRELLVAAAHGVVLSCVTAARRLELWVTERPAALHPELQESAALHVATRQGSTGVGVDRFARVHWAKPLMVRHPAELVDPLPNVLGLVAECLPFEDALATWESALNKRLIDLELLSSLPLPRRARDVLASCMPYSDSGLETIVVERLRWLRVPIWQQVWILRHRVDLLIGERLIVQIDGRHHQGAQRVSDNRHDAELRLRGYHVIRVSYSQVLHDWPAVQDLVQRALAVGLHLVKR